MVERELVHLVLAYDTDTRFVEVAGPFVEAGLGTGERVLVVSTAHNIDLLRHALGPDSAGTVDFAEADRWYRAPTRSLAAYHHYAGEHPGRRVRIIGEPGWAGCSRGELIEWQRQEAAANVVCAGLRLTLLCPYDTRVVAPDVVEHALRTHPELAGTRVARPNVDYVRPERADAEFSAAPLPEPPGAAATLDFGRQPLSALRDFVLSRARGAGLGRDRADELVIAANEMVTNVIRHGGGAGRLRIWSDGPDVVCEVVDSDGALTDPFVGYLPPAGTSEHGWGLWMTRQLCDLVELRHTGPGLVVRLHMHLPQRQVA